MTDEEMFEAQAIRATASEEAIRAYREKLRSLAAPRKWGKSEKQNKVNENTGQSAGYEIEHWDDRRDAVVQIAAPASMKAKKKEA